MFLLSAILIYLVLAAQFESFRDPFIILAGSVPLALAGALLFSFLGLTTLNIYSQVGLITLVGLVAKNGILIVEFANHLQETGLDKLRAVIEASSTRLRPILMTTAATVVGHTPLILATGPGAGARNSIGIMLVSGMIIGTLFTLFVVPAIYVLVARTHAVGVQDRQRVEAPSGAALRSRVVTPLPRAGMAHGLHCSSRTSTSWAATTLMHCSAQRQASSSEAAVTMMYPPISSLVSTIGPSKNVTPLVLFL